MFQQGVAHHTGGDLAAAEAIYRQVIERDPKHPHALNNLGVLLKVTGRIDEALGFYRRAAEVSPVPAQIHNNLAIALLGMRRFSEAAEEAARALVLEPASPVALFHLSSAVRETSNLDLCRRLLEHAVRVDPAYSPAQCNLGNALRLFGYFQRAIDALQAALRVDPDVLEAHVNLGDVHKDHGLIAECIPHYAQAFARAPNHPEAHSNLLLALNYPAGRTGVESLKAHAFWGQQHADKLLDSVPAHVNSRDPARKLRLGIVSSDLRRHSVAYFLEPVFERLDRDAFEIHCYSNSHMEDAYTERFRAVSAGWRNILGLPNEVAANLIRGDGIDILLDVAGHTGGHRLMVFAHKPAPVQVTWLGYPNTTGMKAMDYRLTDAVVDPLGVADPFYTERLVRLNRLFLCYRPPPEADLPVAPPPALAAGGRVTFGSFNNVSKMTPGVLAAWARLLVAVPNSRLVLKSRAFLAPETQERFLMALGQAGARRDQIQLAQFVDGNADHFRAYDQIDIALDPFPYNGTTTTCEAMWMGVPVVTLQGVEHAGRVGATLLAHCGLGHLVTGDVESYIAAAADLAGNLPRLANLRAGLRRRLDRSPLRDEMAFTRAFEDALRDMWAEWCHGGALGAGR
ncbi:MAG: tetratricopeptide repeat protein [Alphaproteobacteria bacterium]|nr:tetratricopeptide repeat protein [Alphaproteobacteria bacterium]